MDFPEDLRYSKEHEWVRVDGASAAIGITSFAQDTLGDIVYVQLPEVGTVVARDATCSEVESTKSVSDIYAPIAGTVVEVNSELENRPELVNRDPYGEGWICTIRPDDPAQVDALLDAAGYLALISD
jgi:glycine cleavage system H protein